MTGILGGVTAAALAAFAGAAVVTRGWLLALAAAVALLLVLLLPDRWMASRARRDYLLVEVPVLLLLFSTLVLRVRDASALADNPVDPSGLYRVACVGLALLLAGVALTTRRAPIEVSRGSLPVPIVLFGLFAVIVFLGAPLSVDPQLTVYRGVELAAGVLVVSGAFRLLGPEAAWRIASVLYWFIVALVASAWIGAAVFPGEAFEELQSPLPFQLHGVFPTISSNSLGLFGVLLALWSLGRMATRRKERRLRLAPGAGMVALGVATLVVAQYRTGYVALALGLALLLLLRGRKAFAALVAMLAFAIAIWGNSLGLEAEPFLLRGQSTQEAEQLSSRLGYWEAALPVWRRSPVLGRGLVTATRFEVLEPLGRSFTSTIHSTWVEALVGTGVIGVALLAASLLLASKQALQEVSRPNGDVVPVLLLAVIIVRSVTGTTLEVFGLGTLLFLTIVLDVAARAPTTARAWGDTTFPAHGFTTQLPGHEGAGASPRLRGG
jgi:O-antigen ligase